MNFKNDKRTVLTLDAGGTNFVFSAIRSGAEVVEPVIKPSFGNNLDKCLANIVDGFNEIISKLIEKPDAISFAFPGPADYPNGIIGDLPNFPAFRGGIALGPFLTNKFKLPVFINNDGDLFTYGEALAGVLPNLNAELERNGSNKRYKNLIGLTIGTGFGAGLVFNDQLLIGDNSIAAEVWLMSNRVQPNYNMEEIVSTRSILAEYNKGANSKHEDLMPYDIYKIAKGERAGNKKAALESFEFFGRGIGDAIANLVTIFDGIVVIGGGITGAKDLYMPALMDELYHVYKNRNNATVSRPVQKVYDYSDQVQRAEFLKVRSDEILIPNSLETIKYDPLPRSVIIHSEMGANKAIQLGAYAYALNKLK